MSRDREETESVPTAIEPARNRTRSKRNGASLAADPTLTGVWTPEGVLDARRLQYCPKAASLSPGARAGAGSAGDRTIARTRSELPGGTATGCHPFLPQSVPPRPKIRLCHRHELLKVRPVDFAPSRLHGLDMVCALGEPLGLSFHPSTARLSPSHRSGSEIPSPPLAFRPLSRKGQSPYRQVKDACGARFGQRPNRPVIHLCPECQWTRVENSTVHRKRADFPEAGSRACAQAPPCRSRCASSRRRRALSLMKPAASCWS